MSFYDVPYTTFAFLKKRAAEEKPYRGTTNEYSLGARRYRSRHFKWYGDRAAIFYGNANLCTIHEDESVEIMRDQLWQGENMLLTATFHNLLFQSNCNKGGDIVKGYLREHKIFSGLRFNLADNSVHKDRPYEIKVYSLDREKTKEIREETKNHFNMIKAFFLASDDSQIVQAIKDKSDDEFTKFCKLGAYKNILSVWGRGMKESRESVFNSIKQHALNQIYIEREAFTHKMLPGGSLIPQGNWGIEIVKLY
jgi:hypothetical protein